MHVCSNKGALEVYCNIYTAHQQFSIISQNVYFNLSLCQTELLIITSPHSKFATDLQLSIGQCEITPTSGRIGTFFTFAAIALNLLDSFLEFCMKKGNYKYFYSSQTVCSYIRYRLSRKIFFGPVPILPDSKMSGRIVTVCGEEWDMHGKIKISNYLKLK